jgi:hypothetical protein
MSSYLFVILGAVLVNNVVLVRILGLCPFMGVSKKLETAIGMGAATTFVLTLGSGTSYLIDHFLLAPYDLVYLRTLSFIVVIAAIVQLTELVIHKTSPLLHQVLGIYLPLITTNCAALRLRQLGRFHAGPDPVCRHPRTARRCRCAGTVQGHGHRPDHGRAHEPGLHGLRRPGPLPVRLMRTRSASPRPRQRSLKGFVPC